MGLDAYIFCDCVERKHLKVPHPYPRQLYVRRNGAPEIRTKDPDKFEKHDAWMQLPPCRHDQMMMGGSHLGSAGYISWIRDVLAQALRGSHLPKFPILLGKVLYSGTHTGDYITIRQVERLATELQQLKKLDLRNLGIDPEDIELIKPAVNRISRLANSALKFKKPIVF